LESPAGVKATFLEFEQPIAGLGTRIEELRYVQDDSAVDISEEIQRLTKRSQTLTKDIYGKLTPWQVAQVARHPQRPYTLDYVQTLFTHWEELHGDRTFGDDASIVGGGGSGGALAIAVGDVVLMMQYAIYSVISPEGCASILWRSAEMAPDAAEQLGITSNRLKTLGLIDKIVPEPLGGAHRDPQTAAQALKRALAEALKPLQEKKPKE